MGNELKDRKNILKLELNALKERLSIEFSVDIADLLDSDIPADENEAEVRAKTERVKKHLDEFGAVNPMALEAYQEMNDRFIFIQAQKKTFWMPEPLCLRQLKKLMILPGKSLWPHLPK